MNLLSTWEISKSSIETIWEEFWLNNEIVDQTILSNKNNTNVIILDNLLEKELNNYVSVNLWEVHNNTTIKSDKIPPEGFPCFISYNFKYPSIIIEALADLYYEYNEVFKQLIEKNKEWSTDYQYCLQENWNPFSLCVQIDMVALPPNFLSICENWSYSKEVIKEVLRKHIFEIENSIAMYQLLENIFSYNGEETYFNTIFRKTLDTIKKKTWKKIYLLAVTQEKYKAMLKSEFGKSDWENITSEEVNKLSWFDWIIWPDEFRKIVEEDWDFPYLLYVRSSEPVEKLRNPDIRIENPLLDDKNYRKIIKANSLTMNIDRTDSSQDERINDTKEYMFSMSMAYECLSMNDIYSQEYIEAKDKTIFEWNKLSTKFEEFIKKIWVNPDDIKSGKIKLRAKPTKGAYGCYWHVSWDINKKEFRQQLGRNLRKRWQYTIQCEMNNLLMTNKIDGAQYQVIHRNFFTTDGNKKISFAWGFASFLPIHSKEAKSWRNHGSQQTIYAPITL